MEIKERKLKINFEGFIKEKTDFEPIGLIEQRNEAMPIPEMMENDLKKMEMMLGKRKIGEIK